jgi:hypothetical protein
MRYPDIAVSISSSPSRMLAATPGASWSSRRARLRNSRSALAAFHHDVIALEHRRSGQRPLRRTILMLVAVSSINTSRVVSRKPCCRSQRRDPDMQISRIRLSDKTSRLHPRHVVLSALAPRLLGAARLHRFNCFDNALTQVTRQCFRHRRSPRRRINADRLQRHRHDTGAAGETRSTRPLRESPRFKSNGMCSSSNLLACTTSPSRSGYDHRVSQYGGPKCILHRAGVPTANIASPRPVPPNFCAVEASAWVNSSNTQSVRACAVARPQATAHSRLRSPPGRRNW